MDDRLVFGKGSSHLLNTKRHSQGVGCHVAAAGEVEGCHFVTTINALELLKAGDGALHMLLKVQVSAV